MKALLVLAAILATLPVGAAASTVDSVGALQMSGSFIAKFNGITCPADRPSTTSCYREIGTGGAIAGLGRVTTTYTLEQDNFGSACGHVHAVIPILVAGKGEIDLTTKTTGCIQPNSATVFPTSDVTVLGGTGMYAGASGSGVLEYRNSETAPGVGASTLTWAVTINVAGVAFDLTPPVIAGATSRVVKTKLASGARVAYAATATDATDGSVATTCLPKPGSRFRVGRTTVNCTASDASGNPAAARFVITVKRVR